MIMLMFHVSLHVKSELHIVNYTCIFGELAAINKEADLTLKRYLYYVLYINHTCNSGPIFNVLQMLRIFQKRIISFYLIVTLCDDELHIVNYTCIFGELAAINKEADLTLKRYLYYVLYINHTCNSGPIFNVLQMLRIFQKRIISFYLIVTLCDDELHFIDNQAVHSNLQNYNLSIIEYLFIICTRYFCNNILYTYCLYTFFVYILK